MSIDINLIFCWYVNFKFSTSYTIRLHVISITQSTTTPFSFNLILFKFQIPNILPSKYLISCFQISHICTGYETCRKIYIFVIENILENPPLRTLKKMYLFIYNLLQIKMRSQVKHEYQYLQYI